MAEWTGLMVSIQCKDSKGSYQGKIKTATNLTITLTKAFYNGIPCDTDDITILANEISNLQLIDFHEQSLASGTSTVTIAKPVPKRASNRTHSTSENPNTSKSNTSHSIVGNFNKSKPIDIDNSNNNNKSLQNVSGTPNRREKNKNKWSKGWKDEACFGSPLDDSTINKDFDFEKNLALFDKQAIWNEINNSQKPDVIKQTDHCRRTGGGGGGGGQQLKYRHDENVIATMPTIYRQIIVPKQDVKEYVTDDGLIVPSVPQSLLNKLWAIADTVGLTWERRVELIGRAATEMALHLLGGGHRMNPRNTHQRPTVVLLCGSHRQGSMGVNTARQLTSQGVNTVVYVLNSESEFLKQELSLYKLTKNNLITNSSNLPQNVDLIICALSDDTDSVVISKSLVNWINDNRAPVLALDPPANGTPGVITKFSLVPVLPLAHSNENGKIYLCNLGFPIEIFNQVGIKYQSPFGPKFFIPLHPNDI